MFCFEKLQVFLWYTACVSLRSLLQTSPETAYQVQRVPQMLRKCLHRPFEAVLIIVASCSAAIKETGQQTRGQRWYCYAWGKAQGPSVYFGSYSLEKQYMDELSQNI